MYVLHNFCSDTAKILGPLCNNLLWAFIRHQSFHVYQFLSLIKQALIKIHRCVCILF